MAESGVPGGAWLEARRVVEEGPEDGRGGVGDVGRRGDEGVREAGIRGGVEGGLEGLLDMVEQREEASR